jgi:molybdenum-dependent DNA-binding transcriptional regulator ModE
MSVGGRGGGGAVLTPFGTELVRTYRTFETYILKRARTAFASAASHASTVPQADTDIAKRRLSRSIRPPKRPSK